jgi:hypothetical protein
MALPNERGDREQQKFVETDGGNVAVRVQDSSINGLDTGNSTTTELAINDEFVGTWLDVTSYEAVQVSLSTKAKGTLYMEWANSNSDTSTWAADFREQFDNPGQKEFLIRRNQRAQYFRVRYLNDGFAQTDMILNTFQGTFNAPHDAVRLRGADGKQVTVVEQDGRIDLSVADRHAENLLQNIYDELVRQTSLLERIME